MDVSEFLIYAIKNPNTQELLYVGQSSQWLIRPRQHLNHPAANSLLRKKIEEIRQTGVEPIIEILENIQDKQQLTDREKFWISKSLSDGHDLCNFQFAGKHPASTPRRRDGKTILANSIKQIRYNMNMNQDKFAEFNKMSINTLRKIEQGNDRVALRTVLNIIQNCGYVMSFHKDDSETL
jgi:DNA-binding transcriptional regulator YiaG